MIRKLLKKLPGINKFITQAYLNIRLLSKQLQTFIQIERKYTKYKVNPTTP